MTRERRHYNDQDRAAGLAALALHGGMVRPAARAAGVPERTMRRWRDEAPPEVAAIAAQKTSDLAALMERIATKAAGILDGALDSLAADPALALDHVADLNRVMGTATDKHQLLTGGATSRVEQVIDLDLGGDGSD